MIKIRILLFVLFGLMVSVALQKLVAEIRERKKEGEPGAEGSQDG